jgi:hypothetical protein
VQVPSPSGASVAAGSDQKVVSGKLYGSSHTYAADKIGLVHPAGVHCHHSSSR